MRVSAPFSSRSLTAFLLGSALCAQGSIVVPQGAATAEGGSADVDPFAYDQVRHIQYIHQNQLGGLATNTLIKEIDYRRDAIAEPPPPQTNGKTFVRARGTATKTQPTWQVRLGNYNANPLAPASEFPTSTAAGWTTTFSAKPVNYPDLPLPVPGVPQPFDVKFPMDVLFPFTGPHLGIDHFAYEANAGGFVYVMDAVGGTPAGGSAALISAGSLGCPSGQNRAYGASAAPGGGDLVFSLYGAEAGKVASAFLGTSSSLWGALPLPLDLSAILLLPGCQIYTDMVVSFAKLTDGAGTTELRVPIPPSPALANGAVFGQWVVRDSRVNPAIGLATSDGLKFTIGGEVKPQMSVVSADGNLAQGRSGFVQPNRGLVVRIAW